MGVLGIEALNAVFEAAQLDFLGEELVEVEGVLQDGGGRFHICGWHHLSYSLYE